MVDADDVTPVEVPFHPNVPKRKSVMLAFLGVLLAGSLGGLIGWGLVDASCSEAPMQVQRLLTAVPGYHAHTPSCDLYLMLGAVVGATLCAGGAAIVAVLVLRAQSEWRIVQPGTRQPARRPS